MNYNDNIDNRANSAGVLSGDAVPGKYNVDPENDRRFKKGRSGNPNGRPKKKQLSEMQYYERELKKMSAVFDVKHVIWENGKKRTYTFDQVITQAMFHNFKEMPNAVIQIKKMRHSMMEKLLTAESKQPQNDKSYEEWEEQKQAMCRISDILIKLAEKGSYERCLQELFGQDPIIFVEENRGRFDIPAEKVERCLGEMRATREKYLSAKRHPNNPQNLLNPPQTCFGRRSSSTLAASSVHPGGS